MDHGIDWYSLSKLSSSNFDLNQFKQIIADSQPHQGIDRVPLQYRKQLLVMFQEASKLIKVKAFNQLALNSELQIKRSIVADNLHSMENQVESSFKQISNMKMIVAEKKRLLAKLKQKVQKVIKKNSKKVYVCTLCQKEEFESFEALKIHLDSYHQEAMMNRNESSNQMNDFKELLMTMKDKEIQMMSMFLKASKQFQTQQLGRTYDKEYKKFMQISGAQTEESKEEVEAQELKSESQFLFFQKSEQFRREMERDQQFRRKLKQEKSQQQTLSKQFYQPNNYYHVFGSIAQNTSEHIEESVHKKMATEQKEEKSYGYYDPVEFLSKFIQKHPTIQNQSRCSLVQDTPKPYVDLKQSKMREKQCEYAAPSISDRLRLQKNQKHTQYDTMYSTKRKFYGEKGYAFNSGPLLEDKEEGSDYQDYFGKDKTLNISIQDEEIKVSQMNQNISSYQTAGKQSFYQSKLLSPKNLSNNSLLDKSIKQKSSELIDFQVSDSFSKRDFQISKDDQTINLSDLKLSKLEKKKEEEKLMKNKQKDKPNQILIMEEPNSMMKKEQKDRTVDLLLQYGKKPNNTVVTSPSTNILKEFEKKIPAPLNEEMKPIKKGNKREIDQYIKK